MREPVLKTRKVKAWMSSPVSTSSLLLRQGGVGHGVDGVVDEVAQHAAHLPAGQRQALPRRADAHLHADAAFLAIGGLGGEQGVDGGAGGLQRAADELYIAIDALDVVLRFLILPHLDQAEDHLQVVLEIMALGAQRAVQVLQLRIGVLKHFALAGDLAGVAGIADVQKRAPDHHKGHGADEQPLGHAGEVELAAKRA